MKTKKYYSLYNQIKEKILAGEYAPGSKLPSKRILADQSGFSLITVERALFMLEDEGYITPLERKGYFVNQIDLLPSSQNLKKQPPKKLVEPTERSLQDFEYSVWFKTVRKVISDNGDRLFLKAQPEGCEVLRNAIADYLYRYRSMTADADRIIIGSGAEQLYESVIKILGRDKIYGVEDPCYQKIRDVYTENGARLCPLKMGSKGITSKALTCNAFDVLHITPFNSYPSSVTATVSKRYEYLKWAHDTKNYIIEDDFDSEFFIPGHPIQSLYALDGDERVIYINTFSKSLSPAMRLGYMILPKALMEKYKMTQ